MASARVVSSLLQDLAQRPRLRRAVRSSPTVACRRAAYACGVWPQLTKEPRVAATAPGAERASGLTTPVPKPGPANELSATPTQLWPFGVGLADTAAGAAITATAVITPKRSVRILASDPGYHFVVAEATCLPDATKGVRSRALQNRCRYARSGTKPRESCRLCRRQRHPVARLWHRSAREVERCASKSGRHVSVSLPYRIDNRSGVARTTSSAADRCRPDANTPRET
jgi:hypothetical protein